MSVPTEDISLSEQEGREAHESFAAEYQRGIANGIWIGAIGSPIVIVCILLFAWWLDL